MRRDTSGHKLEVHLGPSGAGDAGVRRVGNRRARLDKESARATDAIRREIKTLQAQCHQELSRLLSPRGMRELRAIRSARSKLTRSQRIRRALAVLREHGVDRSQILDLRRPYLREVRGLFSKATDQDPGPALPLDGCDSPWVTYSAPYAGYVWSYKWDRTSNPQNPVLERYLDTATGRIGSRVETKVSGADDDDTLTAEYYTGLNVWHTPLAAGALEVYLTFEFASSTYSGKVTDEFGFSNVTYSQYAIAQMTAMDSQDPNQADRPESVIYGFAKFLWGEDDDWSKQVASPRDQHSYYFRTAASFERGSSVLLEAGVRHGAWFWANDESISTFANLDLRLDRIMVRSCADIFF